MRSLFLNPWVGLAIVATIALAALAMRGELSTQEQPDTPTYRDFDFSSPTGALSQIRTVGYPLFLRSLAATGTGVEYLPLAHFGVFVLAAAAFLGCLRAAGYGNAAAFAATTALFLTRGTWSFVAEAISDSVGLSAAIATTGCFFVASSRRGGFFAIATLGLLTFLCYQIRPVYVFLVPLWPTLALALETFLTRPDDSRRRRLARIATYAAVLFVPLLAFCGLRAATVGHFGVVSFDGYNTIGVLGQFLDDELAETVSPDLRPLARGMLRRRESVPQVSPPTSFEAMETSYDPTVYLVAVAAAEPIYGDDVVARNAAFSRLSREILRERPAAYVRWLAWNGRHAIKQVATLLATDTAVLLSLLALLGLHAVSLIRGRRGGDHSSDAFNEVTEDASEVRRRRIERHLLFWTAVAFCAAKVLLVVCIQSAIGRYMTAASTLLPAAIAVLPVQYAETLLRRRSADG